MHSATFSPDGKRVVTASADKTARLWIVFANTQEIVSHAKSVTSRCLTVGQRKTFVLSAEQPQWCVELESGNKRIGNNPPSPAGR